MSSGSFKNDVTSKLFSYKSYIFNMYELDLVLNNLQGLICYKTQPTDLSNTNYMVSSNYSYLIVVICLHPVIPYNYKLFALRIITWSCNYLEKKKKIYIYKSTLGIKLP